MSSGIKAGANRPKLAKNLRTKSEKRFRNDSDAAKSAYRLKMASRLSRKAAKRARKK